MSSLLFRPSVEGGVDIWVANACIVWTTDNRAAENGSPTILRNESSHWFLKQ